jgi:uncharacterized protein with HEPN domain
MPRRDLPYLQHMLDAVERIRRYLEGVGIKDFEADEVLQDAVIRQLEILGEAASRVDPEYRSSTPQIPRSKVIGTRNRLIHGYLSVDMEIVYRTATHHVPQLRSYLEQAVADLGG